MTQQRREPLRILHCHGQAAAGLVQSWIEEMRGHCGPQATHVIAEANGGNATFPGFAGRPGAGRLIEIARAMSGFDLVLTYGWGASNVALGHSVFGESLKLAPLIHHEIGYGADAGPEFAFRRNWFRRIALRSAERVIVETEALAAKAAGKWGIAERRFSVIRPAIDISAFDLRPKADQLPGLVKRETELWLGAAGTSASLRDQLALLEAFAHLPQEWQLVAIGALDHRDDLRAAAERLELSHRVHLAGAVADTPAAYVLLDGFVALPSGAAFPLHTAKAMAAGQPVCAVRGDESALMLSSQNADFLAASSDVPALTKTLSALAVDALGRAKAGKANRRKAKVLFAADKRASVFETVYAIDSLPAA